MFRNLTPDSSDRLKKKTEGGSVRFQQPTHQRLFSVDACANHLVELQKEEEEETEYVMPASSSCGQGDFYCNKKKQCVGVFLNGFL